jgi:hypothetical protein
MASAFKPFGDERSYAREVEREVLQRIEENLEGLLGSRLPLVDLGKRARVIEPVLSPEFERESDPAAKKARQADLSSQQTLIELENVRIQLRLARSDLLQVRKRLLHPSSTYRSIH